MMRVLASHACGLGSIPRPGIAFGLSLLLVLVLAPWVFHVRFSSLHVNQHSKLQLDLESVDVTLLNSIPFIYLFIYLFCKVDLRNNAKPNRMPKCVHCKLKHH